MLDHVAAFVVDGYQLPLHGLCGCEKVEQIIPRCRKYLEASVQMDGRSDIFGCLSLVCVTSDWSGAACFASSSP